MIMATETLKLDFDSERSLPYLDEARPMRVLSPDGRRRCLQISEAAGSYMRELYELKVNIEEIGRTKEGDWVLVREMEDGSEVKVFGSRREMCEFLWDDVHYDPAALHMLFDLGALKFDPSDQAANNATQ